MNFRHLKAADGVPKDGTIQTAGGLFVERNLKVLTFPVVCGPQRRGFGTEYKPEGRWAYDLTLMCFHVTFLGIEN